MTVEPRSFHLTPGECGLLTDRIGVTPGAGSPLHGVESVERAMDLDRAASQGLTSEMAGAAMADLRAPVHRVRVSVPLADEVRVSWFYAGGDSRTMTGFWAEGDGVRLSHPWSADALTRTIGAPIVTDGPRWPGPFGLELSASGFLALLVAVDTLRASLFSSMLDRRPDADHVFTGNDFLNQVSWADGFGDARWLVRLAMQVAPPDLAFADGLSEAAKRGFSELTSKELVSTHEGLWAPGELIRQLGVYWWNPFPAVAVDVTSAQQPLRRHSLCIRGQGPIVRAVYGGLGDVQPGVSLTCLDVAEYLDELVTIVAPPLAAGDAPVIATAQREASTLGAG